MGAVGFTTLAFSINKHPFVQQFIVCWWQTRPLILGQDFPVCNCVGCQWTTKGTKELNVKCRVILKVIELEAGKFFSIKKGIHIPIRHCAVTQIKCNSLKKAVTISIALLWCYASQLWQVEISEHGYPTFYQWESTRLTMNPKRLKWSTPPTTWQHQNNSLSSVGNSNHKPKIF